jgi:hypothetical protein
VANMDREVERLRQTCAQSDYLAHQRQIHADIAELERKALVP